MNYWLKTIQRQNIMNYSFTKIYMTIKFYSSSSIFSCKQPTTSIFPKSLKELLPKNLEKHDQKWKMEILMLYGRSVMCGRSSQKISFHHLAEVGWSFCLISYTARGPWGQMNKTQWVNIKIWGSMSTVMKSNWFDSSQIELSKL